MRSKIHNKQHTENDLRAAKIHLTREIVRWVIIVALILLYGLLSTFLATTRLDAMNAEIVVEDYVAVVEAEEVDRDLLDIDKNVKLPDLTVEEVLYFDVPLDYDLQDHIFELCEEYDVDPAIIVAMIWKESTYRVDTIGDSGDSRGLMQIQSKWHYERMQRLGCTDLLDPYQNVTVGIDLFAAHMRSGKGVAHALMAYNGGGSYANQMTAAGQISYYAKTVIEKSKSLGMVVVERNVDR